MDVFSFSNGVLASGARQEDWRPSPQGASRSL